MSGLVLSDRCYVNRIHQSSCHIFTTAVPCDLKTNQIIHIWRGFSEIYLSVRVCLFNMLLFSFFTVGLNLLKLISDLFLLQSQIFNLVSLFIFLDLTVSVSWTLFRLPQDTNLTMFLIGLYWSTLKLVPVLEDGFVFMGLFSLDY